jgi:tetratricopeptide (TPR) repeat protein
MEEVKDSKHPAVGNILVSLGELFINVDDKTHQSVPILSRAVSIFRPMKSYRRNLATALITLGHAHCYSKQPREATAAFEESLSISRQLFGDIGVYSGLAFTGLSVSHHLLGHIRESKKFSSKAVEFINAYPDIHHNRAAALRCQNLATVSCLQGDSDTATSLLQKASEIIETIQDKKLRLFNVFLSGANSALQGKLEDAFQELKLDPQTMEKDSSPL